VKNKCVNNESHSECYELNNNLGFIHKRQSPKVIQVRNIKISNHEQSEEYFLQLLMLFLPWRDECELKCGLESYYDAYLLCEKQNILCPEKVKKFCLGKNQINIAKALIEKIRIEVDAELSYEQENMKISSHDLNKDEALLGA
jgi:hypothetical protein